MSSNLNEMAAVQLLLQFIPLKDLITAAMHGFADGDSIKDKENADLCYKAVEAFLSKWLTKAIATDGCDSLL